jgi:hypothetical protein
MDRSFGKTAFLQLGSEKNKIYYHRAYKKFKGSSTSSRWTFLSLWIIFDLFVLVGHYHVLDRFVFVTAKILDWLNCPVQVNLWPARMLILEYLPYLVLPVRFPGPGLALVNFIVCIAIVMGLPRIRKIPRPIMVWTAFVAVINAISSAYFIVCPHLFPYDIGHFSVLYLGTVLGVWLMIPIVMGAALAPLPAPFFEKAGVVATTLAYAVIFGIVRYVVFLFLLYKASVLYMAVLFFSFGPLFDFVYIVSFYSYYGKVLALRLKRDEDAWQWLYSH